MSIESLPDYPLLKKLAEALWRNETSYQGAAIMVGSGFSRSAASSGDINSKLPLWNDLLKILSEPPRLYRRVIYLSQAAMPNRVKLS